MLLIAIFLLSILPTPPLNAAEISRPLGISSALWDVYNETAILDLEGAKRNFRWATSPLFFIKGNPTSHDVEVFNNTLFYIASECQNIVPGKASREPNEGVIFHFVPPADFAKVIPGIPKDVSRSYIEWLYYKNRGITKASVIISTEQTDVLLRDWSIRLRILQALGFYSLTEQNGYRLFSRTTDWEKSNTLTKADKELLNFFCSTLVRPWDTPEQTRQYISEEYQKNRSILAKFENRITIDLASMPKFTFHPTGDLIILNGVRSLVYRVVDGNNSIVDSGEIDVSSDAFSIQEISLRNLVSKQPYTLKVFPKNSSGLGYSQDIPFRTSVLNTSSSTPAGSSNMTQELNEAISRASEVYNLTIEAKKRCIEALRIKDPTSKRMSSILADSQLCLSEDSSLEKAKTTLAKIKSSITTTTVNQSLINEVNDLGDDLNQVQDELDLITTFLEDLRDIVDFLITIEDDLSRISSQLRIYDEILSQFPVSLQKILKRNSTLKQIEELRIEVNMTVSLKDEFVENLKSLSYFDLPEISDLMEELEEIQGQYPDTDEINETILIAKKSIPSFYCKKGNILALPIKNVCTSGASKVKVKK